MSDDRILDFFDSVHKELRSINDSLLKLISNHETRIAVLEHQKKDDLRDWLTRWLVRGLLIALGTIATTAGAGGVLKSIFTQ